MISIITPVYNCERFIEQCVENVASQGCTNIEHIIYDGSSTDKTVALLTSLSERHRHLRWVSEPDRGQADAMNKAIKSARGSIIGTLNADDFYSPGTLPEVESLFTQLPRDSAVIGNCTVVDENETITNVVRTPDLRLKRLLLFCENYPVPINPSCLFYHKSLHDRAGYYDLDEHQVLDFDFLVRLVVHANLRYYDRTWGNFRFIPGTKTFAYLNTDAAETDRKRLFERYVRLLGNWERVEARILFLWYHDSRMHHRQKRVRYYLRHPALVAQLLQRKLFGSRS